MVKIATGRPKKRTARVVSRTSKSRAKPRAAALGAPAALGHLSHPPIVEALIDFRIASDRIAEIAQIDALHAAISNDYPVKKERHVAQSSVDFSRGSSPVVTSQAPRLDGYRLESRDGRRVLQAQVGGFTFSQLKPYRDWTTFTAEARRLWRRYVECVRPTSVKRIGLRFVNRIDLPVPTGTLKDWLLTCPEMVDGMPTVSDLFMRVVFPLPELKGFAVITEAVDRMNEIEGTFPIILDVDVFREGVFAADEDEEIWNVLDSFRVEKNRLFFNSITERTRRLFT